MTCPSLSCLTAFHNRKQLLQTDVGLDEQNDPLLSIDEDVH